MSRKIRILFLGTTDFAVPALHALIEAGHEILGVVCQPDRPNGRGKKIKPLPMKVAALELGLPVYQPQRIRDPEAINTLQSFNADLIVVAAYGQILSQTVLDIPPMGCLNIHGSLLPAYRGAAPIQRSVMDGCTETGVTIMQLDAGMDTGPLLAKAKVPVSDEITAGELQDVLARVGAALLVDTIDKVLDGELTPVPQDSSLATIAEKLDRDSGCIDWHQSGRVILRQINGTTPVPGAYTFYQTEKVKCFKPVLAENEDPVQPGTILFADPQNGLTVKTGDGALQLGEIQMPGKKRMDAKAYFRGNTMTVGTVLG